MNFWSVVFLYFVQANIQMHTHTDTSKNNTCLQHSRRTGNCTFLPSEAQSCALSQQNTLLIVGFSVKSHVETSHNQIKSLLTYEPRNKAYYFPVTSPSDWWFRVCAHRDGKADENRQTHRCRQEQNLFWQRRRPTDSIRQIWDKTRRNRHLARGTREHE